MGFVAKVLDHAVERVDGWASVFKGIGQARRDPVRHEHFRPPDEYEDRQLLDALRGSRMLRRLIELLPGDAVRQGWTWTVKQLVKGTDLDPVEAARIAAEIDEWHERLSLYRWIMRGLVWARAFGGALLVVGADDGAASMSEPLDLGNLQAIRWVKLYRRANVQILALDEDPRSENFGQPLTYQIMRGSNPIVHYTRCFRFVGEELPTDDPEEHPSGKEHDHFWGDPLLVGMGEPLQHFEVTHGITARIIRDFVQNIYRIKGLAEDMRANGGAKVRQRIEIAELGRSILNALVLDESEVFESRTHAVAGLPELLDRMGILLSASNGSPVTTTLGVSPGGFGTGEDEDRRWNNVVAAFQRDTASPAVRWFGRLICASKEGPTRGVVPAVLKHEFLPLRQATPTEQATVDKTIADMLGVLVNAGILMESEAANIAKDWIGVQLDEDARAQLDPKRLEAAEAALTMAIEGGNASSTQGEGAPSDREDPETEDDAGD